jgi:hypothetical protein
LRGGGLHNIGTSRHLYDGAFGADGERRVSGYGLVRQYLYVFAGILLESFRFYLKGVGTNQQIRENVASRFRAGGGLGYPCRLIGCGYFRTGYEGAAGILD